LAATKEVSKEALVELRAVLAKAGPDQPLVIGRLPVLDGLAATRAITGNARLGKVRIIILTTFDLDEHVFEAVRSGASGFLGVR
jgi:DNA-binding NarL/FixJ family response regulator